MPGRTQTAVIDAEFFDTAEGIDLSGADLSHEELTVVVVPEHVVEFTCRACFLVWHCSQLTHQTGQVSHCTDCEG